MADFVLVRQDSGKLAGVNLDFYRRIEGTEEHVKLTKKNGDIEIITGPLAAAIVRLIEARAATRDL